MGRLRGAHLQPGARLEMRDWRACGAILRAGDIGFADAWRAFWLDTPGGNSVMTTCHWPRASSSIFQRARTLRLPRPVS